MVYFRIIVSIALAVLMELGLLTLTHSSSEMIQVILSTVGLVLATVILIANADQIPYRRY